MDEGDAGILGEVGAGEVAGGVGIVDGEDAGVEGRSCECCAIAQVEEGGMVRGTAQGGEGVSEKGYDQDMAAAGGGSVF